MSIYEHFRKEERPFIDQVLEWKETVKERYVHKLTDFLDPREQQIVKIIIGQDEDIRLAFFGGNHTAERKRAFLFPPYLEVQDEDFQLAAFQINYPHKFLTLEHRDFLGSLMGLGLKREKFGDINILQDQVQIIVASEISSYVEANLQTIGRASINLDSIPLSKIVIQTEEWLERTITASSLRLDVVLSEIYQLSRSKITPLIDNKRVKVNWKIIEHPAYQLQNGDYLSVRGLGRSKIITIQGKTKKDKWRLDVGIRK